MPWPTMDQDLLEYVSSQITLDAIVNTEIYSRWPDEPCTAGNRAFRPCRR